MSGVMKKDLANKFVLVSFSCQPDRAESLREENLIRVCLQVAPWGCLSGIVLIVY